MTDTTSSNPWLQDFEALSRQYLQSWSSMGQQGAAATQDPGAPWREGVQQWARLMGGSSPHSDSIDRLSAGAQSYLSLMQSMLSAAVSGGQQGASSEAWTQALKNGFNVPGMDPGLWNNPLGANFRDIAGPGAQGFEQLMAQFAQGAGPLREQIQSTLGMPSFGLNREHQERWQQLAAAMGDYQEHNNRYNTLLLRASQDGFSRFQSKLAEREEPGRQLESVRAVYDLWVDAGEEAYAEIALSEEFRKVYGAMVNAQMRVRGLVQKEIEQQTRQLGIPTRSELAGVEKALHELRRSAKNREETASGNFAAEISALRAELAALKQQLGRQEAGKVASGKPQAAARKPAPAKSSPAKPAPSKTKR